MKTLMVIVGLAVLTQVGAAEPVEDLGATHIPEDTSVAIPPDVAEPIAAQPETGSTAVAEPVPLADFIVPIANDLRFGYSAQVGNYYRSQDGGEGRDSRFVEHGLWVSYVRALSGSSRVLSGRAEWRAEVGVLLGQADVANPNGSVGTLRTATLDVGIGPAWRLAESDSSRLEVEIMPFIGVGLSRYENAYVSEASGFFGDTAVTAGGSCVEFGLKANLMWCWTNGWGAALHTGLVQRVGKLTGDTTTHWDNGQVSRSDYNSVDTLLGVRFGLFVAKRF